TGFPSTSSDNVLINNPSPNAQPTLSTTVSVNDITVANGETLTLASGGSISIFGTATNTATITPQSGSTVTYAGGSQTILPLNYFTLNTSGSGNKTLGGNISAGTALGVGSGTALSLSTFTVNAGGALTNSGTFNANQGTVNFNGTTQIIPLL